MGGERLREWRGALLEKRRWVGQGREGGWGRVESGGGAEIRERRGLGKVKGEEVGGAEFSERVGAEKD